MHALGTDNDRHTIVMVFGVPPYCLLTRGITGCENYIIVFLYCIAVFI